MFKTLSMPTFFSAPTPARSVKVHTVAKPQPLIVAMVLVLTVANAVVLMAYLLGVNINASRGYEIKRLQTRVNQLTEENKKLGLKMAEQSSIASIQGDFLGAKFVPVGQTQYLQQTQLTRR